MESILKTFKYLRFCFVSESGKRVIYLVHMNLIILGIEIEKQQKGHNDDDDDEDDDEDASRPALKGI